MNVLYFISSYSVVLPAALGLVRYARINPVYRPFLWVTWLACFNELLSDAIMYFQIRPSVNNNIYVLFDGLLLLLFFRNFIFQKARVLLYVTGSILLATWLIENLFFGKIFVVSSYYRIIYSLVTVLSAITLINYLLANSRKVILKDPLFLISTGLIIFYTIKILVEAFWLYGVALSPRFQASIYSLMIYVNLIKNLLFTLAILWMPRKQIFTMPS